MDADDQEIIDSLGITPEEVHRAEEGAEKFRVIVEAASDEEREVLLGTHLGEKLQSMFLGIKPAMTVSEGSDMDNLQVIAALLPIDIKIVGSESEVLIYDPTLVKQVVSANPDIYGAFNSDAELENYVDSIADNKDIMIKDSKTSHIRFGLLMGYPKDSVETFAKYIDTTKKAYASLGRSFRDMSEPDQNLYFGYYGVDDDNQNEFRASHSQELGDMFGRLLADLSDDERDYLLESRGVETHGLTYTMSRPTYHEKQFSQKVDKIFEISGISEVLK